MKGKLTNTDFEIISYLYDKSKHKPRIVFNPDCFGVICSALGNDEYYMMIEEYLRNELQERFLRVETSKYNEPIFVIAYGDDVTEISFENVQSYKEVTTEVKAIQFKMESIEELQAFTGGGVIAKKNGVNVYIFADREGNVLTVPEDSWLCLYPNGCYQEFTDENFKKEYIPYIEEREKETLSEIRDQMQALAKMITNNCTCAKEVLTKDEASIYLGVSVSYLHKLTMKRQIPFYVPFGKQHYFKRSELDEWITQNRITKETN